MNSMLPFFGAAIVALCCVLWFYSLYDCVFHEPNEGNDRVVWLLVVVFVPLGFVLYLFVRRPQRIHQSRQEAMRLRQQNMARTQAAPGKFTVRDN
jgi:amino acid permease